MNETVKIIFDILQTIILGIGLWYIQRSAKSFRYSVCSMAGVSTLNLMTVEN